MTPITVMTAMDFIVHHQTFTSLLDERKRPGEAAMWSSHGRFLSLQDSMVEPVSDQAIPPFQCIRVNRSIRHTRTILERLSLHLTTLSVSF